MQSGVSCGACGRVHGAEAGEGGFLSDLWAAPTHAHPLPPIDPMRPPPLQQPEGFQVDWALLRRLWPYLSAWRGRAALAVALLVVAKGATVAVPLVLRELVDTLDAAGGAAVVVPMGLVLAYGALRLASGAFSELRDVVFARVRYGIMRRVSEHVVAHLHRLSLRFHLERRTGEISRDIGRGTQSMATLLNYLLFNILPVFIELGLVTVILLLTYHPGFAAITVVTMVLYIALTFALTEWRLKFRVEMNRRDSEANAMAIDALLNHETVKMFGNEALEQQRYGEALAGWEIAARRSQHSLALLNVLQGLLIAGGVTAIVWLAAAEVVAGQMTLGDLVAVNAFLLQLFVPLGFLGTVYSMLKHALADMRRMFDLLAIEPDVQDRPDAWPLRVEGGEVAFEAVSFGYREDRPILQEISFRIPAGTRLALVGHSGAGKSTIARLLLRFYDVDRGRVRIDGQDVRDVTQQSLRRAIGVVPQDTVLFHDTLGYNIRYAKPEASEDEVREAIRMADLERFVAALPEGLDTLVGERGLKLSGGEKQRVAIARAVLKAPRLLVFDEATSSLDSVSEQAISEALRRVAKRCTTLIIAHRLSTVVDAEQILVLDGGRVVELGTHEALLARGGSYASLWQAQRTTSAEAVEEAPDDAAR